MNTHRWDGESQDWDAFMVDFDPYENDLLEKHTKIYVNETRGT